MGVQALLDLLPRSGNSSMTKKQTAGFHRRRFQKTATNHRERAKNTASKMNRFNCSGKAVTADDLMHPPGVKAPKIRGTSAWREWTPEAIQKAAFMRTTMRAVCESLSDGRGRSAKGRRSPGQVAKCKNFIANTILAGQSRGCARLRQQSVEEAFNFWITNTVFDETKLWYMIW
jgi:hypothetical protein